MKKEQRAQAIQRHVEELEGIIRSRFPEAEFRVTRRQEPVRGIWIEAYINADDGSDDIFHVVSERTTDILVDEGLSFFVLPLPKPKPGDSTLWRPDPSPRPARS